MAELKNTPLREFHLEMGAKMVPRSGWNLPLNFSEGTADEHECCRSKAALFDFCADGRFRVAFKGAAEALGKLFSDRNAPETPGSCRRELLVDAQGMGAAFCRVSVMGEDDFFITVPFQSVPRVQKLFEESKIECGDLSEYLCCIGISGPESAEVFALCGVDKSELPRKGETKVIEIDQLRAIISFADDFGEEGFEISFNAECADQIWDLFLETDIPWPAGLAAQESLRLENSLPGAPELLVPKGGADLKTSLRRVLFSGRRAPYAGVKVCNAAGEVLGVVTSGTYCPTLEQSAALVFFSGALPEAETELFCDASGVTVTGFIG